jgi:hypothetical protein
LGPWGLGWTRGAFLALPRWGVPPVDRHDGFVLGEGRRIAPVWTFIKLRTPGEGPYGHEAPHHATVLELVLDGVFVVWAGFLVEPLEVVHWRPCLTLVAAYNGRDAPHAGAAHLLVIVVGHGCGPLKMLLVPLFAALDALHATVDGDIGLCSFIATQVASLLPWAG